MKDQDISDLVDALLNCSVKFQGSDQLREQLLLIVEPAIRDEYALFLQINEVRSQHINLLQRVAAIQRAELKELHEAIAALAKAGA